MVIYTSLKALIAAFVLVLLKSSNGHPLPLTRKPREADSYGRMTMLKKSCIDPHGNTGICMFKWDCISLKGITLSTCVDGFLFGACCTLKDDQDQRTKNDSFKYSTDEGQNSTQSSLELTSVNFILQSSTFSDSQESLVNISSTLQSTIFFPVKKDLVTKHAYVNYSSSDFFTNETSYDLEALVDSSLSNVTTYNDRFQNSTNSEEPKYSTTQTVNEDNLVAELQLNSDYEDLQQKSGSHFLYDYKEFSNHSNKTNNRTTLEIEYDATLKTSQILTDSTQTNAETETQKLKEEDTMLLTDDFTTINSFLESFQAETSDYPSETFTKSVPPTTIEGIYNFSNLSENSSISASTNESGDTRFPDSYDGENKQTNATEKSETVTHEELLFHGISRNRQNVSVGNTTKKIENSTTKGNTIPVWDDYTSLFPSSFHALISQLTSKEGFSGGISKAPNMQLNLTSSNLNSKHIKHSQLHLNEKFNNVLPASSQEESEHTDKFDKNTETKNMTISHLKLGNKGNLFSVPSSNQTHLANQTVSTSIKPFRTKNNDSISTETFTDISQLTSLQSMNESNDVISLGGPTGTKYSTKIIDILKNNSGNDLQVFCNEKSDLKNSNRTKCIQHSNNFQNDIFIPSDNSTKKSNKTKNFLANSPVTDVYVNSSTILDGIHKNLESQKPTLLPLYPSTIHVKSDEIFKRKSSVNKSNGFTEIIGENDIDYDVSLHKGTEEHFSETTSKFSLSSNEEFLYDKDSYMIANSTESENLNSVLSVSSEPQSDLTTNEVEHDIASQVTSNNIATTSQMQTQQTSYLSSTISTMYLTEYINDSFYESSISAGAGNDGDKILKIPLTENNNSSATDNTIEMSLDELVDDFETTVTESINPNTNISVDENYSLTLISTGGFSASSSVNIFSEISSSVTLEEYNTSSLPDTAEDTHFEESNKEDINSTQSMSSVTFNEIQNMTNDQMTTFTSGSSPIPVTAKNNFTEESLSIQTNTLGTTAFPVTNTDASPVSAMSNTSLTKTTVSLVSNVSNHETQNSTFSSDPVSSAVSDKNEENIVPSKKVEVTTINYKWNYKKDCGVRPIHAIGRIVGGQNTYFGKWPWQALVKEATWLGLFVKNKCGGVLITSKYVLTAAHCQPGFLASLLVVLGTHDLSNIKDNRTPVIRNVKRMVVHRHYNPLTFENDLALLEMDTELEFLPHVVPICLPHRNEDFTGEMAFVTGWGKLTHGGDVPNILQEVQVPIVANRDCQMMFYQAGHQKAIQNNFVCAGYINGGQDSCEGDSGGPLMVQRKDKRWVLVGTVSHGIGCADPNLPGVYMRMSSYRPWIDSIINK